MKRVNIVFIGECIIIALLLIVLGVLLKGNGNNSFAKNITKETEIVEEMSGDQENIDDSATSVLSPIINIVNDDETAQNEATQNETEIVESLQDKKIVVFGDSIWNAARGEDGISEYIQQATGATVYNCAIGGTTAALVEGENSMENWTSNCFNGMIYVARKLVPAEKVLGDNTVVLDIIKQVDFAEMDYVIVSYGLNDFFCDVSIYPKEYYEITNYVGALRNGITKLKENYPHLKIIVISPTYTQMFEGEKTFEIGDYVEAARGVAAEMEVEFLDMFHILGNNAESRMEHLDDGVHLSAEGRKVYSDAVIHFLENLEAGNVE